MFTHEALTLALLWSLVSAFGVFALIDGVRK